MKTENKRFSCKSYTDLYCSFNYIRFMANQIASLSFSMYIQNSFSSPSPYILSIIYSCFQSINLYEQDFTSCSDFVSIPKHTRIHLIHFLFNLQQRSINTNQSFHSISLSCPSGPVHTSWCLYWCEQCPQLKLHARRYTKSHLFHSERSAF